MKELVVKNAIEREPGYLYYIDGEDSIYRSKMNRKGGPKKK